MELNREADDEHLKTLEKAVKNKFRWHWLETPWAAEIREFADKSHPCK
jgi:hypothetical protein